jgi:hypothetical protein
MSDGLNDMREERDYDPNEMKFERLERVINALKKKNKEANEFIIDIADLLKMDTDGIGYDELQFTIDDFKDAISALANER